MSNGPELENSIRTRRTARGWSQQQLAERAGIARASVSAIEIGRLVPSTTAALALASALDCRVEDLFQLPSRKHNDPQWAWPPVVTTDSRYWQAEVSGRTLLYPYESTQLGVIQHDGVFAFGAKHQRVDVPPPTLVMACCDPAVGLLADELMRVAGIRLLAFVRSSRQALQLLKQGLVHVAGLHLSSSHEDGNVAAVQSELVGPYRLVRAVRWDEGVASDSRWSSIQSLVTSRARWVGREPGSGARQCLDEILEGRPAPRRMARDHRGVAEAVRSGWADAGICVRIAAEEAGLRFHTVREEAYDLCFADADETDPRIRRLMDVLAAPTYRQLVDDLPGYSAAEMGQIASVDCGLADQLLN